MFSKAQELTHTALKGWKEDSASDFIKAGKDAGWVAAMFAICVGTFAVSSLLARRRRLLDPEIPPPPDPAR